MRYRPMPNALLMLLGPLVACSSAVGIPIGDAPSDGDADADRDAGGPVWIPVQSLVLPIPAPVKVDILFVIDNSGSMDEEQLSLLDHADDMVRELISPSVASSPVVDDLHLGVVTTDMGAGGIICHPSPSGALQNDHICLLPQCEPVYSAPSCDRDECPWLEHSTEDPDDGSNGTTPIWEDLGCLVMQGVGCGFEQPLEASLAALTIQAEHGMPNEGFLRDDSLLSIVYVTDEDDCSTGNSELFDWSMDDVYGIMNLRCAFNPEELYPISRYHDAFVELRGGNELRVAVAAIAGVPADGSWRSGDPIEDLRELVQVDPLNPTELAESCDSDMGAGYPPVRIAELVYSFGPDGVMESICREDWTLALQGIARAIQDALPTACLLPGTPFVADQCRVVSRLGSDAACPDQADVAGPGRSSGWLADLGLDTVGHRRCEVLPADYDHDGCPDGASSCIGNDFSGGLQGWFTSPNTESCPLGEIRLTSTDVTDEAVELFLECFIQP